MSTIPIYLKTHADTPRPADSEFYWLTRDGAFLCRNHPFFTSDVPARRPPRALAIHDASCRVRFPPLSVGRLEHVVGFFDRVYRRQCSEAVVLLFWNLERQRYEIQVPEQEATVWESSLGTRSPVDVRYQMPVPLPAGRLLVGDIHCHGDMSAYASGTDRYDERYRDGIHAVVGRIELDPPDFHLEMAVDGHRFPLKFDQLFQGYHHRRLGLIPQQWLAKVKVKVDRPRYTSWYGKGYSISGDVSWGRGG